MADYLGPNQSRVLDTEDRNWEQIVAQWRKPPLSCEYNLTGKIVSEQTRLAVKSLMPSGWQIGGNLKDNVLPTDCCAGDVLTSPYLGPNRIKLIACDRGIETRRLIAWVNGYRILVQGTNSATADNIIIFDEPPKNGSRVDFVFLEVWRKLIEPNDVVYKYGNVLYGGVNPENDLVDDAVGIETSLRIQVQYRIRVAECDIENYPHGFDPYRVFVQGPLAEPIKTCDNAYFTRMADDIGLWRAGSGDKVAQETLQTVDGYVYAIPMFAVVRRNTGNYDPEKRSNGAGRSLADYLNGKASDRPDNLYSDWIVADDILDMRHVVHPVYNLKEMAEVNFSKLLARTLREKIEKSTLGEDHYGKVLVHADAISAEDRPGSTRIGQGDGVRRVFSNADSYQPRSITIRGVNDKIAGFIGGPWSYGDTVEISLSTPFYPPGSVVVAGSLTAFTYSRNLSLTTDLEVSSLPSATVTIRIRSGSVLIGSYDDIRFSYTIYMPYGAYSSLGSYNGLSHVPDKFLEFRREDSTVSIASKDMDIRVRTADPVVTSDGTKFHMLRNAGASTAEQWDFGHQMIYHVPGNGTENITVPRVLYGYQILGIAAVKVDNRYKNISVSRTASEYNINLGEVVSVNRDIELILYTDNVFFDTNRQARAILNCFEMKELIPIEPADSTRLLFTLDATSDVILALGSYATENGCGFAYVNSTRRLLETTNTTLPSDASGGTRINIKFPAGYTPPAGALIEVPVLKTAAIGKSEGYTIFYQRTPYQGLLDSSIYGRVIAIGPSIITTAGSGYIIDASYTAGSVAFTADSSTVLGSGSEWLSNVATGDIIKPGLDSTDEYRIKEVVNNTTLYLSSPAQKSYSGSYKIIRKDQPCFNYRNIIDCLPALRACNDASGHNEPISTSVTDPNVVLNTRIVSAIQDISDQTASAVQIGVDSADRGRSGIIIRSARLGVGALGLAFEKLNCDSSYSKTYQSYIIDKECSGELYLMVVGSETDNTSRSKFFNKSSNSDVVDIFNIVGRPITNVEG